MISRRETLAATLAAPLALTVSPAMARAGDAPAPAAKGTGASSVTTPASLVVKTTGGKVRGYESDGISTFKGIPYGAPTGGSGRFMPPRPVEPWSGEKLCLVPGAVCPQAEDMPSDSPQRFLIRSTPTIESEDCLNLNVWTPAADSAKRPVMVWIHGGNFSTGSSIAIAATDGECLAAKGDTVVVSVNHRLNFLGYLDLAAIGAPDEYASAGNAGMLDLVLALQWVRDNIASFGGDPSNVTIFGQSGGGLKVTTLCAMPLAAGLFHKAIVQSGSESEVFGHEMTAPLAQAFLDELGVAPGDVAALRDLPLATLKAAGMKAAADASKDWAGDVWKLVGWAPVIDGTIVPASPYTEAGSRYSAQIPLMVGSVRHEFCMTSFSLAFEDMTFEQASESLGRTFTNPDALLSAFAKVYPTEKPVGLMAMISSASFNRYNAIKQAADKAALGGAPAWLYRFDWLTPMLDGSPRAYHCSELPLVFGSVEKAPEATGTSPRALAMADKASDAWLAFARTGNPNHPGMAAWAPYSDASQGTYIFDDKPYLSGPEEDAALIALVRRNRKWAQG